LYKSSLLTSVHIRTRIFLAMATAAAFLPAVLAIRSHVFLKPASQRMAV